MKFRRLFVLYFLMLFFMGIFHLSITPIFEGFDENAHYSSIREIAFSGSIPLKGRSYIDQYVESYTGPEIFSSGAPPYDEGMNYQKFFSNKVLMSNYVEKYREEAPATFFTPSSRINWESQHPPLYYALMAPVLKLASLEPLVTQVFILRLLSYILALGGVFLGMLAVVGSEFKGGSDDHKFTLLVGFILYPYLLPMFFPEFARIGNDSLCLILVGALALLLSKIRTNGLNKAYAIGVGAVLGVGLLTKAFFIPIAAVIIPFIGFTEIRKQLVLGSFYGRISNVILILFVSLAIGASWYLYNYFMLGDIVGSNVALDLTRKGGFFANIANEFSISVFFRGIATTFITFVWGGSWSLAHLPHFLYLPIVGLNVWVGLFFVNHLRNVKLLDPLWVPVYLFVLFEFGLLWHVLVNIALGAKGYPNTPGWYLHILIPFLAPAIGIGWACIIKINKIKPLFLVLFCYAIIFYFIALWSQISLFSGCAVKDDNKMYLFNSDIYCLDYLSNIFFNIDLLGYPFMGIVSIILWAFLSILIFYEVKKIKPLLFL